MHASAFLLTTTLATLAPAALVRLPRAANGTATGASSSVAGADFGTCTPTMDFQLGRAQFNRKATEGTFFPTDVTNLVAGSGQSDALNPNIITNFICNQLTNACGANDAAKTACTSAKATVQGLGTKDQSTADAFNKALGF